MTSSFLVVLEIPAFFFTIIKFCLLLFPNKNLDKTPQKSCCVIFIDGINLINLCICMAVSVKLRQAESLCLSGINKLIFSEKDW